jgi:uncharacterized protein YkwD
MMIRLLALLALCVAASNVFADTAATENTPAEGVFMDGDVALWRGERWMLDVVNWHRARAGMKPVKVDAKVQERCRAHCHWMARSGSMRHSGRSGENIAAGQSNVVHAVQAWVNDPPHAVQIFDPNKTVIGVACYRSPSGAKYYCMEAH